MTALIKLRVKPEKPKRRILTTSYSVCDGDTMKEMVDHVPPDATLHYGYGYYSDLEIEWRWKEEEPESTFQARVEEYKKRLAKWKKWASDNAELIKKEKARRAALSKEREERRKQKQQQRDKRELERLKKKLGILDD